MWTVAVTSTTYPFTRVTVRCSGEGRDDFFYNLIFMALTEYVSIVRKNHYCISL